RKRDHDLEGASGSDPSGVPFGPQLPAHHLSAGEIARFCSAMARRAEPSFFKTVAVLYAGVGVVIPFFVWLRFRKQVGAAPCVLVATGVSIVATLMALPLSSCDSTACS